MRTLLPAVAAVAALVALLAIQELLKLAEAYGIIPLQWPTYIFVALFFLLLALNAGDAKPLVSTAVFAYTAGFAAALSPFFFAAAAWRRSVLRSAFPSALVSTFA